MTASAADGAFLQIQDVVKDFNGFKAVNHVSLDIAKGEIFALLGVLGLRQEHAAAHAGRLRDSRPRAHRARRASTWPSCRPTSGR
jgi:ABC-type microcin C transport system duplicated ATPase subunit YejF